MMSGVTKKLYKGRPNAVGYGHVNDSFGSSTLGHVRRQLSQANRKATKAVAPAAQVDHHKAEAKLLETKWPAETRHGMVSHRVHSFILFVFGIAELALGSSLGAEITGVLHDPTMDKVQRAIAAAITTGHGLAFAATGIAFAESCGHIIGRLLRNTSTAAGEHRNRPFGFWALMAVVAGAGYAAFFGNGLRLLSLTPDEASDPDLKMAVKMLGLMLPLAAAGLAGVFYSNERAVIYGRLTHDLAAHTKRWARLAAAAQKVRTKAMSTQVAMLSLVDLADANPDADNVAQPAVKTALRVEELIGTIPFAPIPIPSCFAAGEVGRAYQLQNRLLAERFETSMQKWIARHRAPVSVPEQLALPFGTDLDEEMKTLVGSSTPESP